MTALIVLFAAAFYIFFYFTYGKSLERNVVRADGTRPTPAVRLRDDVDYVPANKFVLFGHHFASIAGAGPIVGPAIAVVWGLSLIHISEPTRLGMISYAVFCLKKKKRKTQ